MAAKEVLAELDKLLLLAIQNQWQPAMILDLAEARAWISDPGQAHGGGREQVAGQ